MPRVTTDVESGTNPELTKKTTKTLPELLDFIMSAHETAGRGVGAGMAETATGALEMLPNKIYGVPAGELGVAGTKQLEQIGTPESRMVGRFLPLAFTGAGGPLEALTSGVVAGVTSPTGEPEYKKRLAEKGGETALTSALGLAGMIPASILKTGRQAAEYIKGVRGRMGELGTAGETAVTEKGVSEVDRRLDQVPDLKRTIQTMSPQVENRVKLSRKETGIVDPDALDAGRSLTEGRDINSKATKLVTTKFKAAEAIQRMVGGGAFNKYKDAANLKQTVDPFHTSATGQKFIQELDRRIAGGEGEFRTVSPDQSVAAAELKRLIVPEKGKPLDWNLIDNQLEKIRAKQNAKEITGVDRIDRARWKGLGDELENALESWVGKENYPRKIYAASSKDLNDLQDELSLASRQRGEYEAGRGEIVPKNQLADIMFKNRRNTQLSKALYGEVEINELAEQHAANEIHNFGDDGNKVKEWLGSQKSAFTRDIPGLTEKIEKYADSLIRREKDVEVLGALQKRLAGVREDVPAISAKTKQATDSIREAVRRVNTEDPTKLYQTFVEKLRPQLESTGVFSASELDKLEKEISIASRAATTKEKVDAYTTALMKFGMYATGIGTLGYAGIEAGKSMFGGSP